MASRATRQFLPECNIEAALGNRQDEIFADPRLFEKASNLNLAEVEYNVDHVKELLEAKLIGKIFAANIVAQAYENNNENAIRSLSQQFTDAELKVYQQEAEQALHRKEIGFFKTKVPRYTQSDEISLEDVDDDGLNLDDGRPITGPGR